MDEELKRYLDAAAEQRQKVRDMKDRNEAFQKYVDEKKKEIDKVFGIPDQYTKAVEAISALKRRQSLESLGRWVISKCLQGSNA